MVKNNPSLLSGSFSILVHNPKVLEFENKRSYFFSVRLERSFTFESRSLTISPAAAPPRPKSASAQPLRYPAGQRSSPIRLRGLVPQLAASQRRRDQVWQAQRKVLRRGGSRCRRSYQVGVLPFHCCTGLLLTALHHREWFSVLARQMFNPGYALFQPQAADALTYQPNKVRSGLLFCSPRLAHAPLLLAVLVDQPRASLVLQVCRSHHRQGSARSTHPRGLLQSLYVLTRLTTCLHR